MTMYILVFAAAIRLRYTQPGAERPYKIRGGNAGMWIIAGVGLLSCLYAIVLGFIPPIGVSHWPTPIYVRSHALVLVLFAAPPFVIEWIKKPSRIIAHPDPVLVGGSEPKH